MKSLMVSHNLHIHHPFVHHTVKSHKALFGLGLISELKVAVSVTKKPNLINMLHNEFVQQPNFYFAIT